MSRNHAQQFGDARTSARTSARKTFPEVEHTWLDFGPTWPNTARFGRVRPRFSAPGHLWPNSDQVWGDCGHLRSISANQRSRPAQIWPTLANSGRSGDKLGRTRIFVAGRRADVSRLLRDASRDPVGSVLSQVGPVLGWTQAAPMKGCETPPRAEETIKKPLCSSRAQPRRRAHRKPVGARPRRPSSAWSPERCSAPAALEPVGGCSPRLPLPSRMGDGGGGAGAVTGQALALSPRPVCPKTVLRGGARPDGPDRTDEGAMRRAAT